MTAMAQTNRTGRVRVLLIGDAPAVDKVEKALLEYAEVETVRNPHLKQVVVRAGFDWVVGMNVQRKGHLLKESARRSGARFLTIPPNWSGAENALRHDGFFAEVERRAPKPDRGPLTHRPLAAVALCAVEVRPVEVKPPPAPVEAAPPPTPPAPPPDVAAGAHEAGAKPVPVRTPGGGSALRVFGEGGVFVSPGGVRSTKAERDSFVYAEVSKDPTRSADDVNKAVREKFGIGCDLTLVTAARAKITGKPAPRSAEAREERIAFAEALLAKDPDVSMAAIGRALTTHFGIGLDPDALRGLVRAAQRAKARAASEAQATLPTVAAEPPPAPAVEPPPSSPPVAEPPPAPAAATPPAAPAPAPAPAAGGEGLTEQERAVLDLVKETLATANPPYARFSITLREDGKLDVDLARRVVVAHKVTY